MNTILIRAEDKNRWESRAPIVPDDLAKIIKSTGVRAYVEKSDKRFAGQSYYEKAGAIACDNMSAGDVILGIKEIPLEKILDNKVYAFFSHTIKGQKSNMPLLSRIMESGSTLIDYEKITDGPKRLIYFGPYAGGAGAIDLLSLMAEHWADKGILTPLQKIKRAHQYPSLQDALQHIATLGQEISEKGFPAGISPFTVGILGYGNVSKGAQEVFDCLPTRRIDADKLKTFMEKGDFDSKTVYLTIFKEKDLVRKRDPECEFDLQDYFNHPEGYENRFDDFLGCLTLLINAVYWSEKYPRFVTWDDLQRLTQLSRSVKLAGIADISCDIGGAVECTVKSTNSGDPAYLVDPGQGMIRPGHLGEGIVLLAVDNLPCELPKDSSTFFSRQLTPFVPSMINADYSKSLEESGLARELQTATIVFNGKLTKEYNYLQQYL